MKRDAKIPKWIIRNLPYAVRLRHYQKEKNDLFMQIKDLSGGEVDRLNRELADKWMV